jgi:glycosyltransferase involved in cell wall biosynthesis
LKHIALIPAYEPDETLLKLLSELKAADYETVVVDDGSGAKYREIFMRASADALVLTHDANMGKGAALKTGLLYIEENCPADCVVVTLDADGQHRPEDVLRVCEDAEAHMGALCLGSRAFTGKVPLRSRMGNAVTRAVFRASAHVRVWDTQTGLRAFDMSLVPLLLDIRGERYEYEMNMLLDFARMGVPIRETRIETVYIKGNSTSHFHVLRDSAMIYGEIFKFAASSFTGFVVDYSLYSLMVLLTAGLGAASVPLSNVTARIVSATVNFTINKKLVFKSDASALRTGAQYFALAACILAGNTLLLSWMVNGLGVNRFAGKIVTELTFFTLSWLAQKFIIFRKPVKRRPAL